MEFSSENVERNALMESCSPSFMVSKIHFSDSTAKMTPIHLEHEEDDDREIMIGDTVANQVGLVDLVTSPQQASPLTVNNTNNNNNDNDEDESLRLAMMLQQEEEDGLYRLQWEHLQQRVQAGDLTQEDMLALQQLMMVPTTLGNQNQHQSNNHNRHHYDEGMEVEEVEEEGEDEEVATQQGDEEDREDEEDAGGDEEEKEDNEEGWDYEQLLALGARLGDVKTERWRLRASQEINALPCLSYAEVAAQQQKSHQKAAMLNNVIRQGEAELEVIDLITPTTSITNHPAPPCPPSANTANANPFQTAVKGSKQPIIATPASNSSSSNMDRCVVCMDNYLAEDMCRILPCSHYLHTQCAQGWLQDHNACPICKLKVTLTPEK